MPAPSLHSHSYTASQPTALSPIHSLQPQQPQTSRTPAEEQGQPAFPKGLPLSTPGQHLFQNLRHAECLLSPHRQRGCAAFHSLAQKSHDRGDTGWVQLPSEKPHGALDQGISEAHSLPAYTFLQAQIALPLPTAPTIHTQKQQAVPVTDEGPRGGRTYRNLNESVK